MTPLYHGVELTRGAVFGTLELPPPPSTSPCCWPTPSPAIWPAAARSRRGWSDDVHCVPRPRRPSCGRSSAGASSLASTRQFAHDNDDRRVVGPAHPSRRGAGATPAAADDRTERDGQPTHMAGHVQRSSSRSSDLMSIRIGVGELIGTSRSVGVTVDYAEFVAPALLAASAMNGAIYETTMNVFFKMKYEAPLRHGAGDADDARRRRPRGDRLGGDPRQACYSAAFLVTMTALGMTASASDRARPARSAC